MATSTAAGPGEESGESSAGEGSADLDEDVLEMVRRQLDRDPPPSTTALYGRAARINRDIYGLSLRQFHAKYPLRVKREQARRERGGADRSSGPAAGSDPGARDGDRARTAEVGDDAGRRHLFGPDAGRDRDGEDPRRSGSAGAEGGRVGSGDEGVRERVRRVFIRFAREVAEAERPGTLVEVAERLPDRVDEIARIVRARPSGA